MDRLDHNLWERYSEAARDRVQRRQSSMTVQYELHTGDVQHYWTMADSSIAWSRAGKPFLYGRFTLIGTVAHGPRTWLWSWANETLPSNVLGDMDKVRRYGEEHGFPLLSAPGFQIDPKSLSQAQMVAADILGADGLWSEQGKDVDLYFALHDLKRV
ncbi:DUF6882 domain-containing protein [Actinoplanes sp. NPDC051851]|uniref:DUF6882 domain-containing protein n=1 Tax=Actinoplanes sp. NPDC051851 TaxID=3154753 RepID=UPI00341996C0